MKKIAVISLNWKQPRLSIDLVKKLKKVNSTGFNYHIFLIDNHSPDNSYNTFCRKFKNNKLVSLYQTPSNLGFSGGINYGLKKAISAKYDYALIINNDVKVDKDFLKNLLGQFKKDKKLAIAGPKIYFAKGFEYHKKRYHQNQLGKVLWSVGGSIDWNNIYGFNKGIDEVDIGQYNQVDTDIDFISGCCALFDLTKLKKIGLFDDNYFMYLEDADLSTRAKNIGFHIAYVPTSIIWHYNAGSSTAGGNLQQYFLSRNRLLFASKFASNKIKFAMFRQSIKTILFTKYKWQKKGIIDFYLKKLNKGSWQ